VHRTKKEYSEVAPKGRAGVKWRRSVDNSKEAIHPDET